MISYVFIMKSYTLCRTWYHILNIWYHMCQSDIICNSKNMMTVNPTYPTDLNKRYARNLLCLNRLSSQSVYLEQWIYVLITVISYLSLWFNRLSEVSSIWFQDILPKSGDSVQPAAQYTVIPWARDMSGCLCVSLFIGLGRGPVASRMSTLYDFVYN